MTVPGSYQLISAYLRRFFSTSELIRSIGTFNHFSPSPTYLFNLNASYINRKDSRFQSI